MLPYIKNATEMETEELITQYLKLCPGSSITRDNMANAIQNSNYRQQIIEQINFSFNSEHLDLCFEYELRVTRIPTWLTQCDEDKRFRINIPYSLNEYDKGNGESCWAYPLTIEDWNTYQSSDRIKQIIKVILDNDSRYYSDLRRYTILEVEIRRSIDLSIAYPILNIIKYLGTERLRRVNNFDD